MRVFIIFLAGLLFMSAGMYAQKGVGNKRGVSQGAIQPQVVSIVGVLQEIKISPCEYTTGKSGSGTHLMIQCESGNLINLHLGPTDRISNVIADENIGQPIMTDAFRTEELPEHHYIAIVFTVNGKTNILRDDDTFKPIWSRR